MMLTEKQKAHFEKSIKQYRFLGKLCIIPMLIPIAILIYCVLRIDNGGDFSLNILIMGIVFFVVTWVGYMSFNIKADILKDIVEGAEDD